MRILPFLAAPLLLAACCASAEPSDEATGTMFVANKRGASLSRIDLASGAETHRAGTCENPHELTVSPDAAHVMVACYSGRSVEIYAAADLSRVRVIELGEGARVHSALWLADGRVIAGAEGRGSLYVIEHPLAEAPTLTEIGGGSGGQGPHLLAVDPSGSTAWGTIIRSGEVVRYDLVQGEVAARARVGEQIEAIALSPDGADLWVSSNSGNMAYLLDPVTLDVLDSVRTGTTPIRLAAHPGGGQVVSSNFGSGDLTVFDTATATVARTVPVSGSAEAVQVTLVFSADGERLYAAETASDTIAEIDFATGAVLRRLATGPGGDGLAVVD